MTKKDIILGIEAFVERNGGVYSNYYIGITNNPERRINENETLFEHLESGNLKDDDPLEIWESESRDMAVIIEQHFQKEGMKGFNPASIGVEDSKYVYCFKKDNSLKTFDEFIKIKRLMNL